MHFFGSDHHLGHKNIIQLCNRPFPNIQLHDQTLIYNHNSIVSNNDTYYGLGDIGYKCSPQYITNCLSQMNGKLNIILGNHDKPIRKAHELGLLKEMIQNGKLTIIGPIDYTEAIIKTILINNQRFVLSHYPLRSWPHAFRKSIHLYGHSHNKLPNYFRSFNVGVDQNNYFPFPLEEILQKAENTQKDFQEPNEPNEPN